MAFADGAAHDSTHGAGWSAGGWRRSTWETFSSGAASWQQGYAVAGAGHPSVAAGVGSPAAMAGDRWVPHRPIFSNPRRPRPRRPQFQPQRYNDNVGTAIG
jgi:hypothetical protein